MKTPLDYLKNLLISKEGHESKNFQEHIQNYNSIFSFTLMGGKVGKSINNYLGLYIYRIFGQNHHHIGNLLPSEGAPPCFAQLYIYDIENEIDDRLSIIR